MKKFLAAGVIAFALASTPQAQANSFDLNLNDYSIQAKLAGPVGYQGHSELGARALYNESRKLFLTSLDLEFKAELEEGVGIGVGPGFLAGRKRHDVANQNIFGVPMGLRLYYYPPALGGLGIQGKVFYTPKFLSFSDLDRMLESRLRVGFSISRSLQIYAEYQHMRAKLDDIGSKTVDDNFRVGFRARF